MKRISKVGVGIHWGLERYSILIEPHELKQRQERTWLNLEKGNNMVRLKTGYGENVTGMRNVQNLDCLTKKTEHNLFYSETEQDLTHVSGG